MPRSEDHQSTVFKATSQEYFCCTRPLYTSRISEQSFFETLFLLLSWVGAISFPFVRLLNLQVILVYVKNFFGIKQRLFGKIQYYSDYRCYNLVRVH